MAEEMAKVRVPRQHTKFFNAYTLVVLGLWLAAGFYFGIFDDDGAMTTSVKVLYFGIVLLLLSVLSWLRKVEFKCPSCGASIPKPTDEHVKGGDPIYHYCSTCDVLWHVDTQSTDG